MALNNFAEIDWNEAVTLASPYSYVLAVTIAPDGLPNIIGLCWWTYVSWSPPMLIISVGRPRYSHDCIEHLGEFTLNFPSEEMAKGAWLCGKKSGRDTDKFKEAGFTPIPSKNIKPPLIAGSTVAFECRVVNKVEAGDHTIFVADILAMHRTEGKEHHIYTIHYSKMLSLGSDRYANFNLGD
jgi:flavin reductase (DIM6/NTAB) family NADH-FMN oxidoreductase RutF